MKEKTYEFPGEIIITVCQAPDGPAWMISNCVVSQASVAQDKFSNAMLQLWCRRDISSQWLRLHQGGVQKPGPFYAEYSLAKKPEDSTILSFQNIVKCDDDLRKDVQSNFVPPGGTTKFQRISERMTNDMMAVVRQVALARQPVLFRRWVELDTTGETGAPRREALDFGTCDTSHLRLRKDDCSQRQMSR